jgi:hypothetical protein
MVKVSQRVPSSAEISGKDLKKARLLQVGADPVLGRTPLKDPRVAKVQCNIHGDMGNFLSPTVKVCRSVMHMRRVSPALAQNHARTIVLMPVNTVWVLTQIGNVTG